VTASNLTNMGDWSFEETWILIPTGSQCRLLGMIARSGRSERGSLLLISKDRARLRSRKKGRKKMSKGEREKARAQPRSVGKENKRALWEGGGGLGRRRAGGH